MPDGPDLVYETPAWSDVQPEFSIVTATYQRREEIRDLLPSIFKHIGQQTGRFEYIVCDNCSTDGTQELVIESLTEHGDVAARYYRQKENLGLDRNIQDVLSLARGEYVWFIADDDDIAPGMLDVVADTVTEAQLPLVIVRANNIREWDLIPQRPSDTPLRIIDPTNPEWSKHLLATSFLASMVFRRDQIEQFQPKIGAAFGTNYSPWALGLSIISHADRIGYIDELCVLGNVNFDGQNRFPPYKTLIKGRVDVWDLFSRGGVKESLFNEVSELSRSGWRSAAAGNLKIGDRRRDLFFEFARSFQKFGPQTISSIPWVVIATTVPLNARRKLNKLRARNRRD